jgi:hypothetical protein
VSPFLFIHLGGVEWKEIVYQLGRLQDDETLHFGMIDSAFSVHFLGYELRHPEVGVDFF